MRFNSRYIIKDDLTNLLMRVMGGKILELCGEGIEGLDRVIDQYEGLGGIYALVNMEKDKIYIGSSKNLARRMEDYKYMEINNKGLKKDIKESNWEGFQIVIILREEDKIKRKDLEYSIIRKVRLSSTFTIYNIFERKEDQERYGEKVTLRRITAVTKETREKLRKKANRLKKGLVSRSQREKMIRIAKERGYGMRQRRYWFKSGEENIRAKKIRVVDIREGTEFSGTVKEVVRRTGGSRHGIRYSIKNGARYRGRYELTEVNEGYSKSNTTLTGKEEGGNK